MLVLVRPISVAMEGDELNIVELDMSCWNHTITVSMDLSVTVSLDIKGRGTCRIEEPPAQIKMGRQCRPFEFSRDDAIELPRSLPLHFVTLSLLLTPIAVFDPSSISGETAPRRLPVAQPDIDDD